MVGFPKTQPAAATSLYVQDTSEDASDGATGASPGGVEPLHAMKQQMLLRAKFAPANDPAPRAAAPAAKPAASTSRSRKLVRRTLKTAVGLALLIAIGWTPLSRYLETGSVEAVVNA